MPKILVGMSGGVDSSVAALRMKEQGLEVEGAYIKTWAEEYDVFGDCPSSEDIEYARSVCEQIGMPFRVVNLVEVYHQKVVQYLIDGYKKGITPNPDIMCNREIKFGAFLDYAEQAGFDGVATGHYCRKVILDGVPYVKEGIDDNKDQSYFLAMVRPDQLERAHFPIGEMRKPKVREVAKEQKLVNANRKDSQGICFLGKVKINDFLRSYIPDRPGPIVNRNGEQLGEHRGLHHYTIGQRKGIGIPSNHDFKAYVVIAKNLETNELVVAFDEKGTPGLYCESVMIHSLSYPANRNFLEHPPKECRVRYRDPRIAIAGIEVREDGVHRVRFEQAQRALAPGQILAFYENDLLLGGAVMVPPRFPGTDDSSG